MKKKFLHLPDTVIILFIAVFILLDTFLIPRSYAAAEDSANTTTAAVTTSARTVTDTTYEDEHISIKITTYRIDDTNVYAADVTIDDPSLLKTAFADNTYGRNINETTSTTASAVNALLAVNGDFYGARSSCFVVRNGTVYRSTVYEKGQEDLLIRTDGSFEIIEENTDTAGELEEDDVYQVLSFGPALVNNGTIQVSKNEEVGQAMASNPRTAIAQIAENHYLLVVSDGRTSASKGLTLYQMAEFLQSLGAETAYNLDGGGSSTMVFNGKVINQPTTNGHHISERSVSDIVYIGY